MEHFQTTLIDHTSATGTVLPFTVSGMIRLFYVCRLWDSGGFALSDGVRCLCAWPCGWVDDGAVADFFVPCDGFEDRVIPINGE
jgi:hypothetical protein